MLVIGLTGGIGCGKTSVTNLFLELNVPIIDADTIAHQLVKKGNPALDKIVSAFSEKILTSDGHLNRKKLREHIHNTPNDKKVLENIIHPLIFEEIQIQIANTHSPYCILSIPLLFETNYQEHVDRVLVIDCPEKIQIKRVQRRDNLAVAEIKNIISNQCPRDTRLKQADDIIENDSDIETLSNQVRQLHKKYLKISASKLIIDTSK